MTKVETDHTCVAVLSVILSAVPEKSRSGVLRTFKTMAAGSNPSQVKTLLGAVLGISKPLLDDLEQCCVTGEHAVHSLFAE
jgi:translation initiation factor 2-alpha kinase 4